MAGKIVQRDSFNVVGMTFSGPFSVLGTVMPKLWQTFTGRIGEIPGAVNPEVRYDIGREDHVHQICNEYLCVEVRDFSGGIPEGMLGFTVPARTYAVFRHEGPMSGVQQTYQAAFAWIAENGHAFDPDSLRFEQWQAGVTDAFDIWLPVK